MQQERKAKTLKRPISFSGVGIHTGVKVSMTFAPARSGGIRFCRSDLKNPVEIPAHVSYVVDTSRSTTIGKEGVVVHTVEHVLAALAAYQIDHLVISLDNIEPPVGNGSSDVFVELIERAGIVELEEPIQLQRVQTPVYYESDEVSIIILPYNGLKFSYTLCYPGVSSLDAQYFSLDLSSETFKRELASCRTFALYQEITALMDRGLIQGGSLQNAVVVCEKAILSKGGLKFKNEMARHKILDMVGDLSLVGTPFLGHVIAVRSGHAANVSFAKKLAKYLGEATS